MQGPDKGKVVLHTDRIVLTDCVFKVSEAGRQRVIREQRKNVHAGVVGVIHMGVDVPDTPNRVSYNPYKNPYFVDKDGMSVHSAKLALMEHGRVLVIL